MNESLSLPVLPTAPAEAGERIAPAAPPRSARLVASGVVLLALWYAVYRGIAPLADFLTYGVLRLARETPFASAISFFLYEVPKVLLLLLLIVFGVGIVRSFFTPEKTRQILAGKRESLGNVLASLLGVVTPFCSCSAVPMFIGFVTAGVPLGVTFSFLVSAPMVNEVALVLLWGLFGPTIAIAYLVAGLMVAIGAAQGRRRKTVPRSS